ncbi:MAG TPA: PAS domain-containing sensor histidine kinase [Fimbriimonadaceae bacterium]|nr:PAS domain-containing sensor histidine kinase [Fimbriimonadaceae bacterium]
MSALLENRLDAVFVVNRAGVLVAWNDVAEATFGWSAKDVVGRHVADVLAPRRFRKVFRRGMAPLARFCGRRLELTLLCKGNRKRFVEVSMSNILLESCEGYVVYAHDLAARLQAERANSQLSAIVHSSRDAIIGMSLTGVVETWNPAAVRIYGLQAEEIVGKPVSTFLSEERHRVVKAALNRVAKGEGVSLFEYSRLDGHGDEVFLAVSISPIRDAAGTVLGSSAIVRDVTEYRRAEAAEREKREAELANQAKSEFLSRMSHELRTPLNSILGFTQLLEMRTDDPNVTEATLHISRAGRHLLALINEVLDIARIESGRICLSLESLSLRSVLVEAVDIARPLAAKKNIRIESDLPDQDIAILADRQRTLQIVLNLLSNAIKFNRDSGFVRIFVATSEPGFCRISVEDSGIGIEGDTSNRLFAPFERLGADHSVVEGTGLGLAVSRKFAEAMDGSLALAYTGSEGTGFCLEMPLATTKQVAENGTRMRLIQTA